MRLADSISEILAKQGGMLTSQDVSRCGMSRTMLQKYVENGLLERRGRGVYVSPGAVEDELFFLSRQQPRLVFSHLTALFLHGLSDRTPLVNDVTIASDTTISAHLRAAVRCFYSPPDVVDLGKTTVHTQFGNEVPCYDVERTICDIVQSRSRLDDESVLAGLRNYATSRKNLNRLAEYAMRLGVAEKVKSTLEVAL